MVKKHYFQTLVALGEGWGLKRKTLLWHGTIPPTVIYHNFSVVVLYGRTFRKKINIKYVLYNNYLHFSHRQMSGRVTVTPVPGSTSSSVDVPDSSPGPP